MSSQETTENLLQQLEQLEQVNGITPVDILSLPDSVASILNLTLRRGPTASSQLAEHLCLSPEMTEQVTELLVAKGYLQAETSAESSERLYRPHLVRAKWARHASKDLERAR